MSGKFATVVSLASAFVIGFLALFELTVIVLATANFYAMAFFMLYPLLPLFLSNIRHASLYFVFLPVPYLGSTLISVLYLSSFEIQLVHASLLASAIPLALVTSIHLYSRKRCVIGRVRLASFSRYGLAIGSTIFYMVGVALLFPTPMELPVPNRTIFYTTLLLAYIASSILYVNSAYRYRAVCNKLGSKSFERELSEIWEVIGDKFPGRIKDLDLLRYYFADSLRSFEEGDYEKAFLSGYKVINEETVVNPKEYVSDKREGEPSSFSEIRTVLMHSRRKKTEINVKRIRDTEKELPKYCIELLQTCFMFLTRLADAHAGENGGSREHSVIR